MNGADPRSGLHCRHPSFQTGSLPNPVSSRPSDERRQDVRSRYRRPVKRANMCVAAPQRTEAFGTMSPRDHLDPRRRYALLCRRRITAVTALFSLTATLNSRTTLSANGFKLLGYT